MEPIVAISQSFPLQAITPLIIISLGINFSTKKIETLIDIKLKKNLKGNYLFNYILTDNGSLYDQLLEKNKREVSVNSIPLNSSLYTDEQIRQLAERNRQYMSESNTFYTLDLDLDINLKGDIILGSLIRISSQKIKKMNGFLLDGIIIGTVISEEVNIENQKLNVKIIFIYE